MTRCFLVFIVLLSTMTRAGLAQSPVVPFRVQTDVILQQLDPKFCWFHPRVAAIPGGGTDGNPLIVCTLQKHLKVSDHYSGLYYMLSRDGGATWTPPALPPELDWRQHEGETIAVCDVTPGWHAPSGKLLAIGIKLRYSAQGDQLLDKPGSHECAYAVFDPQTGAWSTWQMLQSPFISEKFFLLSPGCVQWLVRPDGTLLIPAYFRGPSGDDYTSTVLHCRFDGQQLHYLAHGDELTIAGGRGLVEPSLAFFQGRYYLTLRNDAGGWVTTSEDGQKFTSLRPWTFDDDQPLGSYNTQAHWLVHSRGLFLCYTRRGADNDHIPRNRAPLFIAQVDTESLRAMRSTEQILIPERGVMLGNFGAAPVSSTESWVTDAEFHFGTEPHPRGADGSIYAARVLWEEPNSIAAVSGRPRVVVLGDSITKGVRSGVTREQTFAAMLQAELQSRGVDAEVINQGIGGERTDQALQRLSRDIIAAEPQVVTVMYGTNDSYVDKGRRESRLTEEQYRGNLVQLVRRLRQAGIQPILMTEPRWGRAAGPNGVGEHPNVRLEPFVEACRSVAGELGTPVVDHFRIWTDAESKGTDIGTWTTDQCHPNEQGHRMLSNAMVDAVYSALAAKPADPK